MIGVTAIDVEVPGDGRSVRGAYLDWMKSSQVMRPMHAEHADLIPAPFAAAAPLQAGEEDAEVFGTVTAPLTAETIRDRIEHAEWRAPFSSGSKRNRSSRCSLSKSRARRSMCRRRFT